MERYALLGFECPGLRRRGLNRVAESMQWRRDELRAGMRGGW